MPVTSRPTTAGSRPTTASSRHTGSCRKDGYVTPDSGSGRSKFDMWNYIKRPTTGNPYELTARYRLSHAPLRRVKSGVVSRRRRTNSQTGSESNDSNRTLASALGSVDFDRDFPDDFDYDANDDDLDQPRKSVSGSHSQQMYVRMCRKLKVIPNSHVLRNLTHDRLVLTHHLLGPNGVKALCVALIENSSVTALDMKDNGLGEEGAKHVADMLTENSFISHLNIADNMLKSSGIQCIIDVIKETDNVIKLDVSGNLLQEYDGDTIRDLIEETRNLKELRCSHNCFRETGGITIGDAVGWNDTLEVLDLSWNHLRREGASAIGAALALNSGLRELNVSWNGFYLEGCKELGKALEKNDTLKVLDLSANRINRECLGHLIKGLKHNSSLKVLKLAHNPITSVGAIFLLRQLLEIKQSGIQRLDLGEQSVEPEFLTVLAQIEEDRDISVIFGAVLGQDIESFDEEMQLMDENPVVVLMEFGKMLNLRLVDLFSMMDKDGSKTLTRFEIKNGLLQANIPLSEKSLDILVEKLDADGDGELDYGELIAGQQKHRRKITRTILMSREQQTDMEDTEVGRVRAKLKKLMEKNQKDRVQPPKDSISVLQNARPKSPYPGMVEPSQKLASSAEGSTPSTLPTLKLNKGALLKGLV